MKLIIFILFALIALHPDTLFAQCTGTVKNPSYNVIAPQYPGIDTITVTQWAGDYFIIQNLAAGKTYQFASSAPGDYLTIRDAYNFGELIASGPTPLNYTATGDDIISVHVHLTSPPCGTQSVNRTTTASCTNCPAIPAEVGIGTTNPTADLDINGVLKLSTSNRPDQAGMIRWNVTSQDFEGYNGTTWLSLTKSPSTSGFGYGKLSEAIENIKLTATDGNAGDAFGNSVSISGDYALVGAPYHDESNEDEGAAYIFKRSGNIWTQEAQLTASDGDTDDNFGKSVSLSGDYALVGAYLDNIGSKIDQGSVYIFKRSGSTWTQEAKLTASDGDSTDYFGTSVSLSGDYALIGASEDLVGGNNNQGSAYIFKRSGSTWTQEAKLTASDGVSYDKFGFSVSISAAGDYAIIGAYLDDIGANTNQGSAYIFKRSGISWLQEAKLSASDGTANDNFGVSVSISGIYSLVGADGDDIGSNTDQGSAYIYIRTGSTWSQLPKLTASDGSANDNFGNSVSISGDYALVGANADDIGAYTNQGSAYLLKLTDSVWKPEVKLTASDGAGSDLFGYSVSISGDRALVGANSDRVGSNSLQGSAYLFYK